MLVIENCNSLSDLRQKIIDGEEVRTVRQEPCEVSEYDKDHIWYKGNQYISLRRFLEVKAEAEKEPCEDAIRREDAINAVSEALEHVFVENEDVAKKMINKLPSVKPQESCEDTISRQAVIEITAETGALETQARVKALPPVTPQPKTGRWWERDTYPQESRSWDCSECQEIVFEKTNYCPNCGAKMQEVDNGDK